MLWVMGVLANRLERVCTENDERYHNIEKQLAKILRQLSQTN
jgi:hypothetical protein